MGLAGIPGEDMPGKQHPREPEMLLGLSVVAWLVAAFSDTKMALTNEMTYHEQHPLPTQ